MPTYTNTLDLRAQFGFALVLDDPARAPAFLADALNCSDVVEVVGHQNYKTRYYAVAYARDDPRHPCATPDRAALARAWKVRHDRAKDRLRRVEGGGEIYPK